MEKGTSYSTVFSLVAIFFFALGIQVEARASSLEIDAKLKLLNKPAVKTIKSEDGDIIDCVDIYKQPAFDHPALKNHRIQMRPSFYPASQYSSAKNDESGKSVIFQTWQRSGTCPDGTIPIRRIRKEDLLRADSLDQFGRKPQGQFRNSTNTRNRPKFHFPNLSTTTANEVENSSRSYLMTIGNEFLGAQADINVWNPAVALPDDFTTGQIWVKNGDDQTFESVEAGWIVNPKLYGDAATHFFIYWTADAYGSTGCFDLTCSGFVQTSKDVNIGGIFDHVSSPSGDQVQLTVVLIRDNEGGNWWLKIVPDNVTTIAVGYWPGDLFRYLSECARTAQWGGEVYSLQVRTSPHTATAMGSGSLASNKYGRACYINNVRIMDNSASFKYPDPASVTADEPACYTALNYVERSGAEPIFFFGGPGQDPTYCP
ncbi:hypothetical protein L6164_015565 [Bauhinia variegata]|uniref:Uncharacterized protein n=1 Tax=Bauhinia variegata TaxID=167791 RepID=A0ACB9NMY6_BAUVA|nr:hypothetical protein L6164_015565 [Bauhinia variegata]